MFILLTVHITAVMLLQVKGEQGTAVLIRAG